MLATTHTQYVPWCSQEGLLVQSGTVIYLFFALPMPSLELGNFYISVEPAKLIIIMRAEQTYNHDYTS